MEQTFDDLSKERQQQMLSFTFEVSFDTAIGIVRENILFLLQRGVMTGVLKNPKVAAVIGVLLFLPGAIMFSLMMLGIEPSFGFLQPFLQPSEPDTPHILGSLIFLTLIIFFPALAVIINVAATEGNPLKGIGSNFGIASLVGFLLVLPFLVLELTYGQKSYSSFPIGLFVILWILPTLVVLIVAPMVQTVRRGESLLASPITLILRIAFIVLIGAFWMALVQDQMPCFLGVPNCD
jgi:hypothetical protein